jgi:hypothetical protein
MQLMAWLREGNTVMPRTIYSCSRLAEIHRTQAHPKLTQTPPQRIDPKNTRVKE